MAYTTLSLPTLAKITMGDFPLCWSCDSLGGLHFCLHVILGKIQFREAVQHGFIHLNLLMSLVTVCSLAHNRYPISNAWLLSIVHILVIEEKEYTHILFQNFLHIAPSVFTTLKSNHEWDCHFSLFNIRYSVFSKIAPEFLRQNNISHPQTFFCIIDPFRIK